MKLHHIFQDLHVCGTSSVSQLRRVVLQHFAVKLAAFSFFHDQQHWILSEQTSLMFVYNFLKTVYKPDFCWWLTRSPWEHTVSRRQTAQRRFGWRKTKNKQTGVNLFIRVVAGPPATDSGFTQFWDVRQKGLLTEGCRGASSKGWLPGKATTLRMSHNRHRHGTP